MKSRNKKRLLALVLCMVVAISNSSFIFASETGQAEYPQEAEVQTQDEAVADDMDVAAYAAESTGVISDLETGMYLVQAETVQTSEYTYDFTPYLVSLPNNYYSKENPDDTWVYDVTTGMKPQQTQRYGDLEIFKDLTEYNASLKDALFVFQVEGTRNGEQVYSDVVSIKFNQAGKKSVLVKHLPAGTKVTVKEVYAGGSYSNTSGDTQETVIVAEGITDNPASVSFTNTYNGKLIPGTGIVNHFENKDGEWSWEQQTDEPAIAN